MEQLTVNGQPIGYETIGKGRPVLLLHGFCEDRSVWDEFLEPLEDEDHQFILADLPGFGDSPLLENASIDQMAAIFWGFLDKLGHKEVVLLGHSMGGYVSLAMAEQQPERVNGLILFHSHALADSADKKAGREKGIEFINRNGHQLYVKQLLGDLFYPLYLSSHRYILDRLIYKGSNFAPEGIINALEAMRDRPDRTDVLKTIPCPVQFIIGAEETVIPTEVSMEQTHLPAISSIDILPKCNHMGMFEAAKQSRKILKRFLEFINQPTT
ncbi:MAG: alpha/beta fold hydrolase [Saprospiraceae bacterium]|nr:alpha/beta fold hydrolase [Saprospiraceae bacterium]